MISSEPENANYSLNEWNEWLATATGQYALNWEQKQFNKVVDDTFGFDALQVGMPALSCLAENRMPNRWLMLLDTQPNSIVAHTKSISTICHASVYDLPFASESIDLIALPHVLEFSENPHEALREVHRVLRPEGRIVISGFNPMSLWGVRQYTGRIFHQPFLPESGRFISHFRIKDWLNLLNYSIDRGKFGCYAFPTKKNKPLKELTFFDKAGDRWWPFFGSIFMLSAIKRNPAVRLVGKIKSTRPRLKPQLAAVQQTKLTTTNEPKNNHTK